MLIDHGRALGATGVSGDQFALPPGADNYLVEAEGTLRVVIENLIDAQEGLQKIGEEVNDETLKRFFLAEEDKWITLKVSTEGLRTINKNGLYSVVKKLRAQGEKI